MDESRRKILELLQEGNLCGPKVSEIAEKLNMAVATVHRKIKKMEQDGTIKEYVAHINGMKVGKNQTSLVWVQIDYPRKKKIIHEEYLKKTLEYLSGLKEVQEIHIPTGTWDLVLKVKTEDLLHQYKFISEKMMPLGNILRMESSVWMKTFKESSYIQPV
jgi:Lrp/AsnC family transcriptional regulator for asnA, asnC and gidA